MLENIITILNTKLNLTNYFREIFPISELKEVNGKRRPVYYCGKNEYKNVSDFDNHNGLAYWRLRGETNISESVANSTISNKKLVTITYPLRLVACIKRELMSDDTPYNADVFARSLQAVLTANLNGTLRSTLRARSVVANIDNVSTDAPSILAAEYSDITDMKPEYILAAINLDLVVTINQDCLETECDLLTDCEALLSLLTTEQKNSCILPDYDFTDQTVLDSLSAQQIIDLQAAFCGAISIRVSNSDDTYDVTTAVDLELPDITVTAPNGGTSAYPSVKNYACTQIGALADADLISQLTDAQLQAVISGRLQQRVVQVTTLGANVYTKPSDLVFAFVVCISGGGGGGSGRRGAAGGNRFGGSGGSSGTIARRWIAASAIGVNETITIGAGGTAGAAQTVDTSNGISGGTGGDTSFGTLVIAVGGNGGSGGTTSSASSTGGAIVPITSLTPAQFPLSLGSTAGTNGNNVAIAATSAVGFSEQIGARGTGAAGLDSTNTIRAGGVGSRSYDRSQTLNTAAAAGIAGGGNGGDGIDNQSLQLHFDYVSGVPLNTIGFGTSGGSGGSNNAGAGGSAGLTGLYGVGGSGGGASQNGANSGAGAEGSQGCCIVFEYYV